MPEFTQLECIKSPKANGVLSLYTNCGGREQPWYLFLALTGSSLLNSIKSSLTRQHKCGGAFAVCINRNIPD